MPHTFDSVMAQYVADHEQSPYGEAFGAWLADASELRAFDSAALDEAAQIARLHASSAYLTLVADTLHAFGDACDLLREQRAREDRAAENVARFVNGFGR
jgi:hypothetical protein